MPPGGYFGKALLVDLNTGSAEAAPIDESVLRSYVGGAGLGTWLMHEHCPAGIDPLDPRAPLMFVFSPLVGTPLTTSAKFAVVAKSPLTGRLTDALASSHFAIAGKLTGHDAIVLTGACEEPSYVLIDRDEIRIEPAGDLCGLPAADAEARLREQHGPAWRVAAIGPAGEKAVRYATISHDGRHAGRGGLGAVMGSKLCKAILVRPRTKVASADPAGVLAAAKDLRTRSFGAATAKYRNLGTMANLLAFNAISTLPTRNFTAARFDEAPALGAEEIAELDWLRAHLPWAERQEDPDGVRERVRPGSTVRSERRRRGDRGQRALRRARPRHDLDRRDDRVGDGMRREGPDRRSLAALRRCPSAAPSDRGDRRPPRSR